MQSVRGYYVDMTFSSSISVQATVALCGRCIRQVFLFILGERPKVKLGVILLSDARVLGL